MILIQATLKSADSLEISIHKNYLYKGSQKFFLFESGKLVKELKINKVNETNHHYRYFISGFGPLKVGYEYEIQDDHNSFCAIDCSVLMKNSKLDDIYYFDGELGAIYSRTQTIFRVFSPLASEVSLMLFSSSHQEVYPMRKDDNGTFYYKAIGDYDEFEYLYLLKINGVWREAIDPYAKSLSLHSRRGVVINPDKFNIDFHDDKLDASFIENKAVIYELSVRDFTSSLHSNIKKKAKYAGLFEEGKISEGNNPAGIDYLKFLGVTHVQLMPVTDFLTTNDQYPENTYNWGYDQGYLFSPEGSYASYPERPYSRIYDLKMMIASLHKASIRVILDMVFNHQFTVENSSFEKICPNYYFRFNDDGTLSNGSFCGNEFESRRKMARKFMVDCCVMYVKEYHVDGFRFDLMGLTDIDTIKEIYQKCKQIRPDFMLYGEGWDMPSSLKNEEKCKQTNSFLVPEIGFFNDRFRDMVKGKSSDHELSSRGYLLGDLYYADAFVHCFLSSSVPYAMPPLYKYPSQSINYVECHDNATISDKLNYSNPLENETDRMKRIILLNVITILSYGVAFLHAGQEIGLSKGGVTNSYNSGDEVNAFQYETLDKRIKMAKIVKDAISLKRQYDFLAYKTQEEIADHVHYENQFGRVILTIKDAHPFKEVKIIINPSNENFQYSLEGYYKVLFNEYGKIDKDFYVQNILMNGISLIIVALEVEQNRN